MKLVIGGSQCVLVEREISVSYDKQLMEDYFQSYRVKNYSPKTIAREKRFLVGWLYEHGVLSWEAMAPVVGRRRIQDYGKLLLSSDIRVETVRSYLGMLRKYFSYILEFPYLHTSDGPQRIQHYYGPIEQPVSEFDLPHHVYDGERLGVPFDPERLYEFYSVLRKYYLKSDQWRASRSRNYAMVVLAGESGLRVDELLHLEVQRDLFFESHKLQTRFAKGSRGSGKKSRLTLFTPLARDTIRYYLTHHRPLLVSSLSEDYLFLSQAGQKMTYSNASQALSEMIEVSEAWGFSVASHMSWHWFRRFFATRFIEKFPHKLPVLVELLGHSSPNTVHRYIRHSEAWQDQEIQNVLEGAVQWPSIGD